MAMLKAALLILVEETREPEEILSRLDAVVRSNRERRFFVTATLGLFNVRTGVLRLTNAGHPPTYRIRGAEVEEILLPSSPLGGLGHTYVGATLQLQPGDALVWLSDGLIEATNAADEPFGYDSVKRVLAGGPGGERREHPQPPAGGGRGPHRRPPPGGRPDADGDAVGARG